MPNEIICPICNQSDQVEKVSTLYLVGTELQRQKGSARLNDKTSQAVELLQARQQAQPGVEPLRRKLAPPSSGKQTMIRPIHPDLAVLAFSLIVPVFLYGILTSQPGAALPALAVLALFYGLYLWQRRRSISRFEGEQARKKQSAQRTSLAIERWMKLYYCAREELVFEPGTGISVPVDQMMGLLFQESREL
jgi:hypothetical protein